MSVTVTGGPQHRQSTPQSTLRRRRPTLIAAVVLLVGAAAVAIVLVMGRSPGRQVAPRVPRPKPPKPVAVGAKMDCIYSGDSIARLAQIESFVGRKFNCVMTFANDEPTWSDWVKPWFLGTKYPDRQWARWKVAGRARRLIVTLSMDPYNAPTTWRQLGAEGQYDKYVSQLAHNLVVAGLGNSVIRLDPESNLQPGMYSVGSTGSDYLAWKQYWARFARIMKTTPKAHFEMDWTVNAGVRDIPFDEYYPGSRAVDIIGVDAYDSNAYGHAVTTPMQRWKTVSTERGGLDSVISFAKAEHKPLSIPEWGLAAPGSAQGGGDDPYYIEQMARVIGHNKVSYQSYFLPGGTGTGAMLLQSPHSLGEYRRLFAPKSPRRQP